MQRDGTTNEGNLNHRTTAATAPLFMYSTLLFWCYLLLGAVSPGVSAATRGGTWCRCGATSLFCEYQWLRFRPGHDRSAIQSYVQEDVSFTVIIGKPVPRIILQVARGPLALPNTTAANAAAFDGNALSSAVLNAEVSPAEAWLSVSVTSTTGNLTVAVSTARPVAGQLTLTDLIIVGSRGQTGYLNFSLSTGPWVLSPLFTLADDVTGQNAVDPQTVLAFGSTGLFYSQRRSGPFDLAKIVVGRPLPPFTVSVVDVGGVPVFNENLATMTATAFYEGTNAFAVTNITLAGATATISGNVATFTGLQVSSATLTNLPFRFQFSVEGRTQLKLLTQMVSGVATPVPASWIALGGPDRSFLNVDTLNRPVIAIRSVLPRITLVVQDSAFVLDPSVTGLSIRASSAEASLAADGSVVAVRNGVASFDRLSFASVPTGAFDAATRWPVAITFTAGLEGNLPLRGMELVSPPMNITLESLSDVYTALGIRYRAYDSFITYEGESRWADGGGTLPPIVLEVVDERQRRVASSGGVLARIQSVPSTALTDTLGNRVRTSVDGLVTFDGIVLRLTPGSTVQTVQLQISTDSMVLLPSRVTLVNSTKPSVSLRFETFTSVISSSEATAFATQQVPLPPIVLEVLDSRGDVDRSANEVVVSASSSLYIINSIAVSHHGRVVFPALTFGGSGTGTLAFAVTTASSEELIGATVTTGFIQVVDSVQRMFALRFAAESYVRFEGQRLRAARGSTFPPIGLVVVDSDYTIATGAALTNLQVVASSSDGTLLGASEGSVATFDPDTGVAWFSGLLVAAKVFATLQFRCTYRDPAAVSNATDVAAVVGKSISTGEVYFAGLAEPLMLRMAPYDGRQGRARVNTTNGSTPLNSVSELHLFDKNTKFAATFELVRGGLYQDIPDTAEDARITATASDALRGGTAAFDAKDAPVVTKLNATFEAIVLQPDTYVKGFFQAITFTSSQSQLGPVGVGSFVYNAIQTDADEPVVVVDVSLTQPAFSIDLWLLALAEVTGLPSSRIEILRVVPAATASTGYALTWKGTRVELRFLSPTTADKVKSSSRELADLFLAMDDTVCDFTTLRIARKRYRNGAATTCDVYQLEDQLHAARRCVATSDASQRCACHEPLFETVGELCQSLDQLGLICSEMNRCTSETINSVCFAFELSVYLAYIRIGAGVLGSLLLLLLLFLWKSGFFHRRHRLLLKKKAKDAVSMRGKVVDEPDALLI